MVKTIFQGWEEEMDKVLRSESISRSKGNLILVCIVGLTALLRLYTMNVPAIDRTAWKEIDYIMISKNYDQEDGAFLYPRVSWPAEEPRITAMELPVVPYVASLFYPVFGVNSFSVRLPTFIAFLLLIVYTYKLVLREGGGRLLALLAAFVSALIPLFSEFRNLLFSEPALIFFSVFCIYQYAQWMDFRRKANLIGFVLGFSMAVSLKPTALYLLLPLFWIHFRVYKFNILPYFKWAGIIAASMVIPVLWYVHAYFLAKEYIDVFGVFGGRFGGHDKFQTLAMLSGPSWYLAMLDRLRGLLLGRTGGLLFVIGLFTAWRKKAGYLFAAYLLAIFCFFAIVAEGQLDAPYRQLTIVPAASFFMALGTLAFAVMGYTILNRLVVRLSRTNALLVSVALSSVVLLFLPLRRPHIILPRNGDTPVHPDNWLLAEQIRKYKTEDSRMIMLGEYTIHEGGNDFSPVTYYYAGVTGWSLKEGDWNDAVIDSLKARGATLMGAIGYKREPALETYLQSLSSRYKVLYDNPEEELLLLSLKQENN